MKNKIIIFAALFGMLFSASSCEDILNSESDRLITNPSLSEKTDSMYYMLGILKGVQQAIDQYVLVNEMRGDLTEVNQYTSVPLRQLANFSINENTENKYDSAWVYYRIINNCNYFIAHRDTTLKTGSINVALPEYAQAKAIRLWAYIQLCKTYGKVPFVTEPITSISQANESKVWKTLDQICDVLAPDLAQYINVRLPNYGNIDAGSSSQGSGKNVVSTKLMFPVALVLGDAYLETDRYEQAAHYYFEYLRSNRRAALGFGANFTDYPNLAEIPNDFGYTFSFPWNTIFTNTFSVTETHTVVAMATNRLQGLTSELPIIFGFNYYATAAEGNPYLKERQVDASAPYLALASAQEYYYTPQNAQVDTIVNSVKLGDMRRYSSMRRYSFFNDTTVNLINKYNDANVIIYRDGTIYLRLAECLNRMNYPDAAFMILKDGISREAIQDQRYLDEATVEMLRTTIPFLSEDNEVFFDQSSGIHSRGCGPKVSGPYSAYSYATVVGSKLAEMQDQYGYQPTGTKNDTILAVEDLICDEYALETAFEGYRFNDLTRIAQHRNNGFPGANFGGRWLATKLAFKNPQKDLTEQQNWYLPFK